MTRSGPQDLPAAAELLDQRAASYLDGVVRQPGKTCQVCAVPVEAGYKAERPGPDHYGVMAMLVALGLQGHAICASALQIAD